MNKNITISILVIILVVGGGYLLLKTPSTVDNTPAPDTSSIPSTTPVTTTPQTPTTPTVASAPIVETTPTAITSNSTALVTGTVQPNGAATTYWFEYGETSAFGTQTAAQAVGSGFSLISTPSYISGLKANTLYYFRLSAKNNFATVKGAMFTFQTNSNPPPKAMAPTATTNTANSIARETATINGQVNPNGSQTNYWFEYGTTTNLGGVTSIQSLASGTTSTGTSAALTGLMPLTKYYFRLNAQNQYGTVNGTILNFTTTGPANPAGPIVTTDAATNTTSQASTLNGQVNPNGAATTYWFEYSKDTLLTNLIGNGTPQQTLPAGTTRIDVKANITGLQANTTYYYHLASRNSYGVVYGKTLSVKTKK